MYTNYNSNVEFNHSNSASYDWHGFRLRGGHLLANAIRRKDGGFLSLRYTDYNKNFKVDSGRSKREENASQNPPANTHRRTTCLSALFVFRLCAPDPWTN
jgi:hypothetical protein